MRKLPAKPTLTLSPMGGTPRLGKPKAYGGSGSIYQVAPNYGKPKSLGKINTSIKR